MPKNTHTKGALGVAALSAPDPTTTLVVGPTNLSHPAHQRALVAIQRPIPIDVWPILTAGNPYHDLGGDCYTRRRPKRISTKALPQLRTVGIHVTFSTPSSAVVT